MAFVISSKMFYLKKTMHRAKCENCGKAYNTLFIVSLLPEKEKGVIDLAKMCKNCLLELRRVAGNTKKARGFYAGRGNDMDFVSD